MEEMLTHTRTLGQSEWIRPAEFGLAYVRRQRPAREPTL
jgi:hypothetical protein